MIYFIRHGQSEANLKGLFAGQRDNSALTDKGKDEARITGEAIKDMDVVFNKIVSSPLLRSLETATIIARHIGFDESKIEIDNRITEYDMGSLTGTPIKNISSEVLSSGENAEDTELFKKRVVECIKDLSNSKDNVLVVSHAGVGRLLETVRDGIESKFFYDLPAWHNASVTRIDWIN
jgi:broad specificity phosphatase PhoE